MAPTASEPQDLYEAFAHAVEAVGASVCRTSAAGLLDVVLRLFDGSGGVVAEDLGELTEQLRSRGITVIPPDGGRPVAEGRDADVHTAERLPGARAGLCAALAGIAASGTVVIGPGDGYEGYVSLLPAHSVVLLRAADILPDLAAALTGLAPLIASGGSRLAFVTGPSRTSDIELTSVVGVHGPVRLDVVVIDD